jgi:hypothetical protein
MGATPIDGPAAGVDSEVGRRRRAEVQVSLKRHVARRYDRLLSD